MFIPGCQQTWNHLGLITRHVKSHAIMWCPYTRELNNKITYIHLLNSTIKLFGKKSVLKILLLEFTAIKSDHEINHRIDLV